VRKAEIGSLPHLGPRTRAGDPASRRRARRTL
jgi:hypothetical protein